MSTEAPAGPPTSSRGPSSMAAQVTATPDSASDAVKCTVKGALCQPDGASHVVTGGVVPAADAAAGTTGKSAQSSATRVTGNRHDFLIVRAPWTGGSGEPLHHVMVAPDERIAARAGMPGDGVRPCR